MAESDRPLPNWLAECDCEAVRLDGMSVLAYNFFVILLFAFATRSFGV